jgi:tetratricopeptide (TPR) repeat protein
MTQPERHLTPIADRMLPPGRTWPERKRSELWGANDWVAAAFERGVAAYNADDADAALDAFEEAVRLAPAEPEGHINLGLVYLRLQRPEDAMRELAVGTSLARSRGGTAKRPRRNRCNE